MSQNSFDGAGFCLSLEVGSNRFCLFMLFASFIFALVFDVFTLIIPGGFICYEFPGVLLNVG